MIRINLIKGQEVFEPVCDAEPAPVAVPEGVEELMVLDHLVKKNRESKNALAETLLNLGFSSSAVERILYFECEDESSVPRESPPIYKQADFIQLRERVKPRNPFTKMAPFLQEAYLRSKEV